MIIVLKSKIHNATVTEANVEYIGSITIDKYLMKMAGIVEFEKVLVADVDNGERLETYVIKGKKGEIGLNGAAARKIKVGHKVIIMAFKIIKERDKEKHKPKILIMNKRNEIERIIVKD